MAEHLWTCSVCHKDNPPHTARCRECGVEGPVATKDGKEQWGFRFRQWLFSLTLLPRTCIAIVLGEIALVALLPFYPATKVGWTFVLSIGAIVGPCAMLISSAPSSSNGPGFVWRVIVLFILIALALGIPWYFVDVRHP